MRKISTRKSIAIVYVLGLVLTVALVDSAAVLAQPILAAYEAAGVDDMAVQFVATMALLVLFAVSVTIAIGLVLRSTTATAEVADRS